MKSLSTKMQAAIGGIVGAILIFAAAAQTMPPNQSFAQQSNSTTPQTTTPTTNQQQGNETIVVSPGNVTSLTLNSTIIPLQRTTIEVRTTTKSIDSKLISELQNTTVTPGVVQPPSIDLSKVSNQTVSSAAGQATSTIVTRTVIPYNVTTFQLTTTAQNQSTTQNISPSAQLLQLFTNNASQLQYNQTANSSNKTNPE